MQNSQKIAEQLLNRPLKPRDGYQKQLIEKTEKRLGFALPPALRWFYLNIGNNAQLCQSFSRFTLPDDLKVEQNKLIFLEENQQVCWWALNINELQNDKALVYQLHSDWSSYSENLELCAFLEINIYYQLAQGGYENCATIQVEDVQKLAPVLQLVASDKIWQKVVDHNHLVIYCNQCQLIWYFTNQDGDIHDMIFASTLIKKDSNALIEQFGFDDLN